MNNCAKCKHSGFNGIKLICTVGKIIKVVPDGECKCFKK